MADRAAVQKIWIKDGFRQASRILFSNGAPVIMRNCRAETSTAAVDGLKEEFGAAAEVSFVRMDLSDLASVRAAAAELLKTALRIDALICNAAVAQVPTQKLAADGFESQLGTNHYGHFLLCGRLFDRIEESTDRIEVVASLGYNVAIKTIPCDDMNWDKHYSVNPVYSQSKLAQMMFACELQDRVKAARKNVGVFVCHPGASATSLISTSGSPVTRFIWWLMSKTPIVQTAQQWAFPEVICATEEALQEQRALCGPTGRMEAVGPVGKGTLNPHAYDKLVVVKLWEVSEMLTGFTWRLRANRVARHAMDCGLTVAAATIVAGSAFQHTVEKPRAGQTECPAMAPRPGSPAGTTQS